jgi:phosphatidate cytidylyltransferase
MRLGLRLGSAAVLIAVLVGALVLRGGALDVLAGLAVCVACWELGGLLRRMDAPPVPWVLFPLTLWLLLRHRYPADWPALEWGLGLAVAVGLVSLLARPRDLLDRGFLRWSGAVGGALYLGLTIGYLLILANLNVWLVVVALASAMVGDTVALFVGTAVGRTPFFRGISPRKSLEGALGGALGTIATWVAAAPALTGLHWYHAVVLGALCTVAAQGGDLVESALKRAAGVKDSSELIPGHGGLLDRLDSLVLLGPVLYGYLRLTGLP